ncbi:MAG: J domain-containing protein, partial [Verrucomicrobiota bacterium]
MKPSFAECHALLDLTPGASWAEVQEAYRLMVRVWHPDRHQHDPELAARAGAKLARINAAYQELREAHERGPTLGGFPPPPRPS